MDSLALIVGLQRSQHRKQNLINYTFYLLLLSLLLLPQHKHIFVNYDQTFVKSYVAPPPLFL